MSSWGMILKIDKYTCVFYFRSKNKMLKTNGRLRSFFSSKFDVKLGSWDMIFWDRSQIGFQANFLKIKSRTKNVINVQKTSPNSGVIKSISFCLK